MPFLRRAGPALFGLALFALFFASTLDPAVQLYYRDTGRLYYPVKLYIAQHLRAGHLPLWDTMTEAGVSLLGQVTPGLFHPATLLYLAFPFDLAFKLNHMLGPLLGGIGAWWLARRLGARDFGSLAAAIAYGGCGYLVSMTGSNLPFALGAGSVPLAVDAVLGFVEKPAVGRFAWAGAAVALIALAGEPQSMWIAGILSGAWALLQAQRPRQAARNLGLVACCGALALCLGAPALLPALAELKRSDRASGVTFHERLAFANHPLRLAGLLVPSAFDDSPEAHPEPGKSFSTYSEYFASEGEAAFSDSIVMGAPALLLAAAAAFAGRKGRLLLGGALLFALASTGEALGIEPGVLGLLPLEGFFRYAEKLIAPASLLFALAAAVGADFALAGSRRSAAWLAAAAAGLSALCLAGGAAVGAHTTAFAAALVPYGTSHSPKLALDFLRDLRSGLSDTAALAAALGGVALWRWLRQREVLALGALTCAASVFASAGGLLYRCPVEYVRGPFDLAERMITVAGRSAGRWRIFVNNASPPALRGFPGRLTAEVSSAEALMPQHSAAVGIEAIDAYFSVGDPIYKRALSETPEVYFDLFGVRYAVEMPEAFSEEFARSRFFRKAGKGYWVREYVVHPRAFVAGRAVRAGSVDDAVAIISAPDFRARSSAVLRGGDAPQVVEGQSGPATLERRSPERMQVRAQGPGLLVVGEHFDPGWRASIDGRAAPVLETDLAALGVVLPPGPATVELRFVPRGLVPGLWAAIAAATALVAAVAWQRRQR